MKLRMIGTAKEKRPAAPAADDLPPVRPGSGPGAAVLPFCGSLLSGVLLALSFPGFGHASLAFVGLVPLFFAVRAAPIRRAAVLALLAGLVFFMLTLSWLSNLAGTVSDAGSKAGAWIGYAVLALYCALYFIPPALTVSVYIRRWGLRGLRSNLRLMFAVTIVWVASEYARGLLFTGFPWNPLGVSQYANPVLIQLAAWGGVPAVTAMLVWMNAAVFVTIDQYVHGQRARCYRPHIELMFGLLPIGMAISYGLSTVIDLPALTAPVEVALIQPNIPQTEKWEEAKDRQIRETLGALTEAAARAGGMDLIIWPETALPDYLRTSAPSRELAGRMAALGYPLLIGTMDLEASESGLLYYNSSLLLNTNGLVTAQYNKQHLVPFGEYVPFPKLTGSFAPVAVDFTAGSESTLFHLDGQPPFSVLICFEDAVAGLSEKAVRAGACWLVNQTNDAWFDPGAQSEQHLAHAVFRCVENRVPMVRCGNTGISCAIDAYGKVERLLRPRTIGFAVHSVQPRAAGEPLTFYTRYRNPLGRFSVIGAAVVGFVLCFGRRTRRAAPEAS